MEQMKCYGADGSVGWSLVLQAGRALSWASSSVLRVDWSAHCEGDWDEGIRLEFPCRVPTSKGSPREHRRGVASVRSFGAQSTYEDVAKFERVPEQGRRCVK